MKATEDAVRMRAALRLAARARGRTAPNPLVGALIYRGDRLLGAGWHRRPGAPHAEAMALERAGSAARGATLYCTLEPCAHSGRTPPCIDSVLRARFRRVVIGISDPDPRTTGRSLARLRRAGCSLRVGVEEQRCREQNRGYLSRIERGRPFTRLKLASTLDGRIATASGESRWITGEESRAFVHRLRASVDALAVGSETARSDDPALTARRGSRTLHRPLRIVVDSRLRTPVSARLLPAHEPGRALFLCTRAAGAARRQRLEAAGAQVVSTRAREGHVDLRAGWKRLAALGVNEVMVEGGAGLAAALLRAQLVDELTLFLAPRMIGAAGIPAIGDLGAVALSRSPGFQIRSTRRLGADLLIVAEPG